MAYRRQNQESFLDAFIHVFLYFGGVPHRVIFDYARVTVKDGFGSHTKKQKEYGALAAHYGFDAIFCNPAIRQRERTGRRDRRVDPAQCLRSYPKGSVSG